MNPAKWRQPAFAASVTTLARCRIRDKSRSFRTLPATGRFRLLFAAGLRLRHNTSMIASEFSRFADDLIREMGPQLPSLASGFQRERGKGIIQIELHDADTPEERTTSIDYLPLDRWPVGSHPRQLCTEYDPQAELILHIVFDQMALTRRLRFFDLQHVPEH
jgi:hypothetical protein